MSSTIWIGNIHFSHANIAVKLHTAVSQNRIQFHQLHKTDRIRLEQRMVCALDHKPVPHDEQVKGFLLENKKYVLIDPDELHTADAQGSRTIDVHEFVTQGQIDSVYLEKSYYLEQDGSAPSYNALVIALKETNSQGICTWVMRKRAYVGALSSVGRILRLSVLRYADEIIPAVALNLEEFALSEKELSIGSELVKKLTVKFQPDKFFNEHLNKLRILIEKKAHGEKIKLFKPRLLKPTTSGSLLKVLEESLKKAA